MPEPTGARPTPVATVDSELFRLLVQSVRDYAIFLLDPKGHVASWNEGARRIKGYAASEIIGQHFSVFYPSAAVEIGYPQHELEVAEKEGRFEDEGWRIRKDGTRFWADVVITAVRDNSGTLVGFAKVTRDLTERRMAEQALQESNRHLAAQIAENETFIYSISHDLRGPLVNLQGFSQELETSRSELTDLLARLTLPEEPRAQLERILRQDIPEAVGYIQTSVTHLSNIIDALLRLSRAGRVVYHPKVIDTQDTVRRVVSSMRGSIDQAGAQVVLGVLPPVIADPVVLEQAFSNLIANALQYRHPSRPCRVEVTGVHSEDRKRVVVQVKDNGRGISEAALAKLFTAFQRFHPEAGPGEGIGLALIRRMIERQQGQLHAESNPDQGASFFLELPSAEGARPE